MKQKKRSLNNGILIKLTSHSTSIILGSLVLWQKSSQEWWSKQWRQFRMLRKEKIGFWEDFRLILREKKMTYHDNWRLGWLLRSFQSLFSLFETQYVESFHKTIEMFPSLTPIVSYLEFVGLTWSKSSGKRMKMWRSMLHSLVRYLWCSWGCKEAPGRANYFSLSLILNCTITNLLHNAN